MTYRAPTEAHVAKLVRRRDKIADAYAGLELVMPALYREAAKRCGAGELKFFREILEGVSERMPLPELYKQAGAFFTALLRPMNNGLMMDLELDSENYLHIPFLPIPAGENPFSLTAKRLKIWLKRAILQIEDKRFDDYYADCALFYRESAERVDDYLCALSRHSPASPQTGGEYHWFRVKERSELYSRLTMTMIRRIVAGEFDNQKYLPSIPKLSQESGVTKDTASKAVAFLNSLGIVRTIDKKGSVIALKRPAASKDAVDFSEPIVRERLTLFLDALQIVSITARGCAASIPGIPDSLIPFAEERTFDAKDWRMSPLSFQFLMNSFIQLLPYYSLKNIFTQLEELILWRHYLEAVDESFYPDAHETAAAMERLVRVLKNRNQTELADAYGTAFSLIERDVYAVLSRMGKIINRPDREN